MDPGRSSTAAWIDARPRRARDVAARVVALPGELWRHRELVASGVRRDLVARFSGSLLGVVWTLVAPLALFAVYYFIFTRFFGMRFPALAPEHASFVGVYLFVGALAWSAFAESLTRGANALVEHGTLIKKLAFPKASLPLELALSSLATMTLAMAAFVVACAATSLWPASGVELLWALPLLALQLIFTFGLALLVASLNVFLRDTSHALGVLLTVWMFATPVFWIPLPVAMPQIEPWLGWIELNPMHHLLYAWRAVLLCGEPQEAFSSSIAAALLRFVPWAAGAYLVGASVFSSLERRFADEV